MNLLLCPGVYLPHQRAGSEIYLHKLAVYLQSIGHIVNVIAHCPDGKYSFEGISVHPCNKEAWQYDNIPLWKDADLVFTQLSGTYYVMNKMRLHNKKVINLAHNNGAYAQVPLRKNVYTIYNCENTRKELNYNHEGFVCPPPVFIDHYKDVDRSNATYITLINHNENKGGKILIEIAKRMPSYQFLAVQGGYYEQVYSREPNIKYVPLVEDIRPYLAQTRIMIAPSAYESYGQAQVEALCCGIPVIATNLPGFRESLGSAGIWVYDRENIDAWINCIEQVLKYDYPMGAPRIRAEQLTPSTDLKNLNDWLEKINKLAIS